MNSTRNVVFEATLVEKKQIAVNTIEVTLSVGPSFSFIAGQYIWLEQLNMPVADPNGNRRAFSICCAPTVEQQIRIIYRSGESGYKQSINALNPGEKVRIHGPFGSSFRADKLIDQNLVIIAGGTGVAPFLSILESLKGTTNTRQCVLIHLNHSDEETPYKEHLQQLAQELKWVTYLPIYHHMAWEDIPLELRGSPDLTNQKWWVSGPQDLIDHIFNLLTTNGIKRESLTFEHAYPRKDHFLTREKLEQSLVKEGILFQAIQSSTNHMVITDGNGQILFANQAAQAITGYTSAEMMGNTPRLWGGMMSPDFYQEFWRKKQSGQSFDGELINRRKNGDFYYSIAHIAPIFDDQRRIAGYIGTEEDITRLKIQEQKIEEDSQRLKFALEGSRDGLWDWKIDSGEVYFSPRWLEMLGYSEGELAFDVNEWRKRIHPHDVEVVEKNLTPHLEGKTPFYECEHRILCKDGSYKWILDRGMVTNRDQSGKALRMVGTHADITERKTNEEKMSSLNERFELATKSAKIGVWDWNLKTDTLEWDDQMYTLFGVNKKLAQQNQVDPKTIRQLNIHPDDLKLIEAERLAAINNNGRLDSTYRIILPDKTIRYVRAFGTIKKDENGIPINMTGVNWDVTLEKQVDQAKTEFVSLASHQLRTPLTSINWYTEMLLSGDAGQLNDEQKKYLDEVYAASKRMVDLVTALLNVSRIELGTFAVDPVQTDLITLLRSVLDELKLQIDEKYLQVTETHEEIPNILADQKLMRIVYQNLLTNAVKYTPDKGTISIKHTLIDHEKLGKCIHIEVSDSGVGIPQSEQGRIFDKLYRASNVQEIDTQGTGLGLYIIKAIVEQAGGQISFSSQENQGTTFYVDLPLAGMIKKEGSKPLE